jgi:hypothetical protein
MDTNTLLSVKQQHFYIVLDHLVVQDYFLLTPILCKVSHEFYFYS